MYRDYHLQLSIFVIIAIIDSIGHTAMEKFKLSAHVTCVQALLCTEDESKGRTCLEEPH